MGKKFVLLHGAWHGGWCWDGVIKELEKAGHAAEAPTMPGHAPEDDRSGIVFQDYVDKIVAVLQAQTEPVVLVGHSSAGYMIQAAAPLAADKLDRLVFHNAFVLPDKTAQFDLVPKPIAQGMTAAAKASPDNCVPADEDFIRGVLMADATKEKQDELIGRLVPQPLALFLARFDVAPFNALDVPRTVLFANGDISMPPGAYLDMARGLGEFDLVEIPGGHETLFTDPAALAAALIKIAG